MIATTVIAIPSTPATICAAVANVVAAVSGSSAVNHASGADTGVVSAPPSSSDAASSTNVAPVKISSAKNALRSAARRRFGTVDISLIGARPRIIAVLAAIAPIAIMRRTAMKGEFTMGEPTTNPFYNDG